MGELVNFNQARKARDRAADKAQAAQNRAAHGRLRDERTLTDAERELAEHRLDGAKRERPEADDPGAA